jgi:hypothetical protein
MVAIAVTFYKQFKVDTAKYVVFYTTQNKFSTFVIK